MTTKHTHEVLFGRRVNGCPRCAELNAGARPVEWASTRRAREDAAAVTAIRAHDCKVSRCGPVCTFGQW